MPAPSNRTDSFAQRSLADAIARGPLTPPVALKIANELALELKNLHDQTRVYGKLTPNTVLLTDTGAQLMPQRSYWEKGAPEHDVQAFGGLVYQMLHGNPPPPSLTAAEVKIPTAQGGEAKLKATCTKLALRCANPKATVMTMQQVATELRLLGVLQRQEHAGQRTTPEEAPPPAPAYRAPATWTPPIEMLIESPGALPLPPPPPLSEDPELSVPPREQEEETAEPVVHLGPSSFGQPAAKPPAKEDPRGGKCPRCDAAVVYESRARSKFELLLERMKVPLVRCHRCYHRYFVVGSLKFSKDMPVGSARRFRARKRA